MANDKVNEIEDSCKLSIPQSRLYIWAKWFFLLSVLLKPFYIFDSGKPQIADIMFVISLFALLLETKRIYLRKADEPLYIFVFCVAVIQGIYFLIYQRTAFLVTASYYIFNLAVVYVFNWFVKDFAFLRKLQKVLKFNLLLQLALLLFGYNKDNYARHQGTFNDPNQMAFFCISCFFLIFIIDFIFKKQNLRRTSWWPWLAITAYLIYATSSSGMFVSVLIFVVVYLIENATNFASKKQMLAILAVFLGMLLLLLVVTNFVQLPEAFTKGNRIYAKVQNIFRVDSLVASLKNFAQDRYLLPLLRYPEYILFGAGEGLRSRFVGAARNEIHSTPLAILFYYGIVPWSFWVLWIVKKLKAVPRALLCVYVGLILESFTLANYRQPLFWVLLLIAETAGEVHKADQQAQTL